MVEGVQTRCRSGFLLEKSMDKKSFIIFDNWARLFTELPTEEAGILIKMLCNYKLGKEVDTQNQTVYAMFMMMKMSLDESDKLYQEKCEKNKINASKGGKRKAENAKKIVANGSERLANCSERYRTEENATQIVAKPSITDTDTDTNTDTDNIIKDIESGYSFGTNVIKASVIPPKIEWVETYCKARNNSVDPQKFFDFYESKGWKVGKEKMKNWQACVRTWEKRETPAKEEKKSRYDFEELKRMVDES